MEGTGEFRRGGVYFTLTSYQYRCYVFMRSMCSIFGVHQNVKPESKFPGPSSSRHIEKLSNNGIRLKCKRTEVNKIKNSISHPRWHTSSARQPPVAGGHGAGRPRCGPHQCPNHPKEARVWGKLLWRQEAVVPSSPAPGMTLATCDAPEQQSATSGPRTDGGP